jgi:hypothetical protein
VFLLDSILAAPGNAAFVLFKELARKAQDEWLDDDAVKEELQQLYSLLEAGQISDRDFEARECRLLERLEQIARAKFNDKWGAADAAPALPPAQLTLDIAAESVVEAPIDCAPIAPAAIAPAAIAPAAIEAVPVEPVPVASPALPPPAFAPPAFVPGAFVPAPPLETPLPGAPVPPAAPASPGGPLSVFQVIESTMRSLSLLKLRLSSITSVSRDEQGWRVTAELVERKGVPDTNDLLGMYEFRLDHAANVLRYERTSMRRRGDLNRS